jgi:hypothetical protein
MIKNTESPKGQVHAIAASQGADAARLLVTKNADKEGWANAVNSVERWLRQWDISGSPPEAVQKSSPVAKPQTAKKPEKLPTTPAKPSKRRVYDVGNPNVHGTVLTDGEQVSLVHWDVPSPWGKESHVSNEQLKDVDNAPTKQTLDVFNKARAFRVMRKDKEHSTHKTFLDAQKSADDEGLWVYAISGGGTVVLLMRPHWGVLLNHEAARKTEGVAKRVLK